MSTRTGPNETVLDPFVPELMRAQLDKSDDLARYWWAASRAAGRRTLDVGCGLGHGTRILFEAGASQTSGVDPGASVIEAARHRLPPQIRLDYSDLSRLPYPDRAFDLVVCFDTVERVEPDQRDVVLDELARILAVDGLLLMSLPRDVTRETLAHRFAHVSFRSQRRWGASAILDDNDCSSEDAGRKLAAIVVTASSARSCQQTSTLAIASHAAPSLLSGVVVLGAPVDHDPWLKAYEGQQKQIDAALDRERQRQSQERLCAELSQRLRESESKLALLVDENYALRVRLDSNLRRALRRVRQAARRLKPAAKNRLRRTLH